VKIMAIQDNLSKVQAVEQLTQQMLRFPDDVQMAMAGEVRKQRQLRKRQVNKSGKADEGKLRPKGELRQEIESDIRGRKSEPILDFEDEERQCCIDFRV